jgi:DmsE family decaheme c-type cytochrome
VPFSWIAAAFVASVSLPAVGARAADDYVGDAACLTCHEALDEGFTRRYRQTIHARVLNEKNAPTASMQNGCESCHGAGREHVEAGGGAGQGMRSFTSEDPAAVAADNVACLGCHKGGERLYWEQSIHDSRDVGCASCHRVMHNASRHNQLAKSTVMDTCGQCHLAQRARQYRNAHMPLREGKLDCSSCHNPHGTIADALIEANTVNDKCYECHADKRGPHLWEHPPVAESCSNCHDPHGTTRASMLKIGQPRLCQSCHIETRHPSEPRSPTSRFVVGSGCLQCHPAVHGSNHPSGNRLTR